MNHQNFTAGRKDKEELPSLLTGHGITLRQIRYFLAVAHNGGVVSAAHHLYVSAGTITEAVKNLENTLGVSLFERKHNGMLLTREGSRFLEHGEKMLFLLDDAISAAAQPSVKGKLRVAASPVVMGYFLPSLIMRFRRIYPAVNIELQEMSRQSIEKNVANGALDIGVLIVSNTSPNKKLRCETLLSYTRSLWCCANHKFASQKSVSMDEIVHEPYIQLCIDEAQENTQQFWKKGNTKPQIIIKTEMMEAVRSYIGNGTGVAILADMLFRSWSLEEDRLITRPLTVPVPNMDVGLVWHRDKNFLLAELFIDFLSFHCGRDKLNKNLSR